LLPAQWKLLVLVSRFASSVAMLFGRAVCFEFPEWGAPMCAHLRTASDFGLTETRAVALLDWGRLSAPPYMASRLG
jgi:hypothetical protein